MTEEQLDESSPLARVLARYGIVAVVVVFYATAALHFEYTPDDAYIYLQYAKHVAAGEGFSFNSESPSYGVTGPLWVLAIASGVSGGLDPYIVAKTLDLVLASLAILVFFVLASLVLKDRLLGLCAAWIFSLDAWFLRWSASGMETSAAILFTLLAVLYVFRNEYLLAAMCSGVLSLLRPEGILLFAVIQVDNFLNTTVIAPARRVFLRSLALYVLIVLPWIVFAYATFGTIVSNTLNVKTFAETTILGWLFVVWSEARILGGTQGIVMLFLLAGLIVAVKKEGWKKIRLEVFPLFWAVTLLLFYVVMNVQVVSRYLLLIIPFVIMYGVWGLKQLTGKWSPSRALVLFALVSVIQSQAVYRMLVVPHMNGFIAGMNQGLKPMAHWLKEQAPPDASVVTPDIGLLGYISDRDFYDTAGLITPGMKRAFRGISFEQGMLERRYETVVVPEYVVDRSEQKERLATKHLVPVMTREFPSLSVTTNRPVFYTLYRVVQ